MEDGSKVALLRRAADALVSAVQRYANDPAVAAALATYAEVCVIVDTGLCHGHPRFKTEARAQYAIDHGIIKPPFGYALRIEHCTRCDGWHAPSDPLPVVLPDRDDYALAKGCYSKRAYSTRQAAAQAANDARARRGTLIRIYECDACGRYHLTRKEARDAR